MQKYNRTEECKIKIDAEFKSLIPPLTPDERRQLEENVLADGCLDSLKTWNDTLLDGHNRYEICTAHDIPYRTEEIPLDSREDAIIWICRNQMGRRNITQNQRDYLMGVQYVAEKKLVGGQAENANAQKRTGQNVQFVSRRETKDGTSGRIGKEYGVDGRTVRRNEEFAQGVDAIGEQAPELKAEILSGRTSATKQDVRAVAKLPEPERPAAIEKIRRGEKVKLPQNIGLPSDVAPVSLADVTRAISQTFREFADTIDHLMDINRDLIEADPQAVISVFDEYIKILNEMKEGLK